MTSSLIDERMKSEELPVGWPWRFLLFSIIIAVTVAVGCVGLLFGYRPLLIARVAAQEEALADLGRVIPVKQQEEFVQFYSQLANLESLLAGHVFASPAFGLLESRTNAAVSYITMEARIPERKIVLEGNAVNYQSFAEQLQAFTVSPEIESVIVNDSNALQGTVRFRVTLTLRSGIFKQ